MEEILASIRRIISEDSGSEETPQESAEAAPPPPPAPEPEPVDEEDIEEADAGEEDDIRSRSPFTSLCPNPRPNRTSRPPLPRASRPSPKLWTKPPTQKLRSPS